MMQIFEEMLSLVPSPHPPTPHPPHFLHIFKNHENPYYFWNISKNLNHTLHVEPLKIPDFYTQNMIPIFPKILSLVPLARSYQLKIVKIKSLVLIRDKVM